MQYKPIIGLIVGPTASGKTAASVRLAKIMDAEIISADSIQIYKGMDIGSAKPSIAEREGIPHHLMDAIGIGCGGFSVAEYQRMAYAAIDSVLERGKYPLVVGGSGLYINSLTYPLTFTEVPSDERLREQLSGIESAKKGALHAMLSNEDPEAAGRIHPNDTKRIIRALEVVRLTGKGLDRHGGDFDNTMGRDIPYTPRIAGITMDRELLYRRINERVDAMVRSGLIEEARELFENSPDLSLPALQGLGYRQLFRHFLGEYSLDEAIDAIKMETRRFAKRQMTWFKRDKRIVWFDASEYGDADMLAQAMYEGVFKEGS